MRERICPYCNAHLDPDEKCDCREEPQEQKISPEADQSNSGLKTSDR